jgi:hypothetical protein
VKRAELLKMVLLALALKGESSDGFTDVVSTDWYYDIVNEGKSLAIIEGYPEGTFRPEAFVTRQDMALIIYRAMQKVKEELPAGTVSATFSDIGSVSGYALPAINYVTSAEIIRGMGDGLLSPLALTTRAQAAVIVYRAVNFLKG